MRARLRGCDRTYPGEFRHAGHNLASMMMGGDYVMYITGKSWAEGYNFSLTPPDVAAAWASRISDDGYYWTLTNSRSICSAAVDSFSLIFPYDLGQIRTGECMEVRVKDGVMSADIISRPLSRDYEI